MVDFSVCFIDFWRIIDIIYIIRVLWNFIDNVFSDLEYVDKR